MRKKQTSRCQCLESVENHSKWFGFFKDKLKCAVSCIFMTYIEESVSGLWEIADRYGQGHTLTPWLDFPNSEMKTGMKTLQFQTDHIRQCIVIDDATLVSANGIVKGNQLPRRCLSNSIGNFEWLINLSLSFYSVPHFVKIYFRQSSALTFFFSSWLFLALKMWSSVFVLRCGQTT